MLVHQRHNSTIFFFCCGVLKDHFGDEDISIDSYIDEDPISSSDGDEDPHCDLDVDDPNNVLLSNG